MTVGPDILELALAFAGTMHTGQTRKYTGEAYIFHPIEVYTAVSRIPGATLEMRAAALLHDVVEDCEVSPFEVECMFGPAIAELVMWLTDVSVPEDGNRAARKAKDLAHIAKAPAEAQAIKAADLISNLRTIADHDPSFASVYLAEKQQALIAMSAGQAKYPSIFAEAYEVWSAAAAKLAPAGAA